nr:pancreatic lipase-related protein 3-like [Procambarus clarkii]
MKLFYLTAVVVTCSASSPMDGPATCPVRHHTSHVSPILHDYHNPTTDDVQFRLYTRATQSGPPEILTAGNVSSLLHSHFRGDLPVSVLVHGYLETADNSPWMLETKNALLTRAEMNVVVVQWAVLADGLNYFTAAHNTFFVGGVIADLLRFLQDQTEVSPKLKVHLIGFSLGAQVCGVAGHLFPGVARITGLDPAGPAFESATLEKRLDPSDADFVDVIHTNAGRLITVHFGFLEPAGHVDMYMNGGSSQYGCPSFITPCVVDLLKLKPKDIIVCSHDRSHEYFRESLTTGEPSYGFSCLDYKTFEAGLCFSNPKAALGYDVDINTTGVFYLDTQGESRFLSRHVKVALEVGLGEPAYHGSLYLQTMLPGRVTRKVEMLSGWWPSLEPGEAHQTSLAAPVGTNLGKLDIQFLFHKNLLFTSPKRIKLRRIEALDTYTGKTYCLADSLVLESGTPHTLQPVPGPCS